MPRAPLKTINSQTAHPLQRKAGKIGTRSKGAAIPDDVFKTVTNILRGQNLDQDKVGRIAFMVANSIKSHELSPSKILKDLEKAATEIDEETHLKKLGLMPK